MITPMVIGGLEGVSIHPLDVEPIGKIEHNTQTTQNFLNNVFSDAILGNSKKIVHTSDYTSNSNIMSTTEAIRFFGIDKDTLAATNTFNQ